VFSDVVKRELDDLGTGRQAPVCLNMTKALIMLFYILK
jgi:hypothetical protein